MQSDEVEPLPNKKKKVAEPFKYQRVNESLIEYSITASIEGMTEGSLIEDLRFTKKICILPPVVYEEAKVHPLDLRGIPTSMMCCSKGPCQVSLKLEKDQIYSRDSIKVNFKVNNMGCSAPVEKYILKMVRKVHFIDEKLKFTRMKDFICMED